MTYFAIVFVVGIVALGILVWLSLDYAVSSPCDAMSLDEYMKNATDDEN